jgi:hypothetical protein
MKEENNKGRQDKDQADSKAAKRSDVKAKNDDDLYNPKTGETRRSEEQITHDINETEEGGGFEAGGGQPFTG